MPTAKILSTRKIVRYCVQTGCRELAEMGKHNYRCAKHSRLYYAPYWMRSMAGKLEDKRSFISG